MSIFQIPSNVFPDQNKYFSQKSFATLQETTASELKVPPTTPRDLIQDFEVTPVPSDFPRLSTVKLPFVREIGVKESIKRLSEIFGCKKFHCNLVQFWFLDFMTDCLWKVQDEFQFPDVHQKVILEWIIFIFNLVRAPHLNFSKREIFRIFDEALAVAEQHIETGCVSLPLPEELFTLNVENEEEVPGVRSVPSTSSSSSSLSQSDSNFAEIPRNDSYLAIELEDGMRFFDLPTKVCPWDSEDDRLSSTIETVSENEIVIVKLPTLEKQIQSDELDDLGEIDGNNVGADIMFEDFYKPDIKTPPRFKASEDSLFSDSISISYESESMDLEEDDDEEIAGPPTWVITKKRIPDVPCPSKLFSIKPEDKEKSEKEKEEEAIQAWYDYHIWQFRKQAMDDPKQGWIVLSEDKSDMKFKTQDNRNKEIQTDDYEPIAAQHNLIGYMKMMEKDMKVFRENRFINTCAIMAIKQIVYDYFNDSFQFCLIKTAYRHPHYLITQELNKEWCTPKRMKTELKRPKPKKKKVEKLKKDKSDKSEKAKPYKTSSSADIAKSDKKLEEPSKKGVKTEEQIREEKEELERLKLEKERMEELEKIAEENRTLVFPLNDAVDEYFFENIFPSFKSTKKKGK